MFYWDATFETTFFRLFSIIAIVGANDDRQRSFAQVYTGECWGSGDPDNAWWTEWQEQMTVVSQCEGR